MTTKTFQNQTPLWIFVWCTLGLVGCGERPPSHTPVRLDCDLVAEIAVKPGDPVDHASSLDTIIGTSFGVAYPEDGFTQHYARCRKIEAGGGL